MLPRVPCADILQETRVLSELWCQEPPRPPPLPSPRVEEGQFSTECHSMLSVVKESWKPPRGTRTARDADLSSAEGEFPTASTGLPSAARWMLPPRSGSAALVWTSDSGHQGPTALCCLNRVEGGSSQTHSHQKGCPGAATIVSNGQARLGSWAGHTWTRSSVPYGRTPPPQVHTHHCPKPLPAVFPLSLDLFSTRQTGGSGPHSHGPNDGAPWPDCGEFCQGPMHRREPPGSTITPAPTPQAHLLPHKAQETPAPDMEPSISTPVVSGI